MHKFAQCDDDHLCMYVCTYIQISHIDQQLHEQFIDPFIERYILFYAH